jgi:hypothetical protein
MTHSEYEQSKRRIEEGRRMGVELVEKAADAQMRALELIWLLQGGPDPAAPPLPAPPPAEPRRHRTAPEMDAEVRELFYALPATFSRRDVCAVLGYEPDRGALYKTLQNLVEEGHLEIDTLGKGQKATLYRKISKAS